MADMFCFQCQQTAKGVACTKSGVCGKTPDIANLQDKLTEKLFELAHIIGENNTVESDKLVIDGLFTTVTNVNFNDIEIEKFCVKIDGYIKKIDKNSILIQKPHDIWTDDENIRSLKSLILFGIRGVAAYAHHASALGKQSDEVNKFFYKALQTISEKKSIEELLPVVFEVGNINLKCMELLDLANTEAYGTPVPTVVPCGIEPGPFIVISGHDLHDLSLLLEQTSGKGINIYTHGEMLPAHGYPKLKKYPHIKGNFGTAWQSQQKEFENLPAPVLFTTNCLMPPKNNYSDRVFTTSVVSYPELKHIDENKDFTPVIEKTLELGGYKEYREMTGINGGKTMTTGFAHGTVLSVADKVIDAVKAGAIKHFFLVGGCDGAASGRNYYTEFVKKTPSDTVVLTLACGKFRFNDLDIGEIGGLPRIMDMGQCNDAYSAIKVASALADAFGCGVNDLPLTLVLSWYEQKAVCILLTLLALGIKNIYLGPTLPAFISPAVLDILIEKFNISPISDPDSDLAKILKK